MKANHLEFWVLLAGMLICTSLQAREYKYGDHLDVAKLISIDTPNPLTCEVVTSTMTYLDSHGVKQTVEFRQLPEACISSD